MSTIRERGILMHERSVRGILEGRKRQTRRVVKDPPDVGPTACMVHLGGGSWGLHDGDLWGEWRCPYGVPGDRLWVRETHVFLADEFTIAPAVAYRAAVIGDYGIRWFRGDTSMFEGHTVYNELRPDYWKWRPSIYMPRWASRILLDLTEVRVERVQEISAADVIAEGVQYTEADEAEFLRMPPDDRPPFSGFLFSRLWDETNAHRLDEFGWDANPWVWALTFDVVEVADG